MLIGLIGNFFWKMLVPNISWESILVLTQDTVSHGYLYNLSLINFKQFIKPIFNATQNTARSMSVIKRHFGTF